MPDDRPDLITLGETMAVIAAPGSLAGAAAVPLSTAGAESNVAIGVARLGLRSTWIGRVGDDQLGERVRHDVSTAGVDVCADSDPEAPTGLMIKEASAAGTRIRYYRRDSAGSRLSTDDLPSGLVERGRWLHLTGITPALSVTARATAYAAAERAQAAGVPYSLDLNLRRTLWRSTDDFAAAVRPLVAGAKVVFGGVEEVAALLGSKSRDPERLARALGDLGPAHAVIKGGAGRTLALVGDAVFRHGAFEVPVVNTVGAGDAFVAGYLAGLLTEPDEIPVVLQIAAACGAYACTHAGDWEALPTTAQLQDFLRTARTRPAAADLSEEVER